MDDIFEKVAKKNHTTKKEVIEEIEAALVLAIKNSKGDTAAQQFWKYTLKNKGKPIPEEIIKRIVKKVME